jgi:hypothetical protein
MRRAGPEQRVPQDKVFALKSLLSAPQRLPELRFGLTMISLFSLMTRNKNTSYDFW